MLDYHEASAVFSDYPLVAGDDRLFLDKKLYDADL